MDLTQIKLDPEKLKKGVWREFPYDATGKTRFLIASANNPDFQSAINELSRDYQHPARRHLLEKPEIMNKIHNRAIAKAIILGWENVELHNKPFEYTEDNAVHLLTEFPQVKTWVNDEATKENIYRLAVMGETAENLKSVPPVE